MTGILSLLQDSISIYDLLDLQNVRYATKGKPCQIRCPFHGADKKPSARVYPETNSVRCFYCNKSWDVISFWAEMNHFILEDGKYNYKKAVKTLADKFNVSEKTYDWKSKLNQVTQKVYSDKTDSSVPIHERERLKIYYTSVVARDIHSLSEESRSAYKSIIFSIWDKLCSINLYSDNWRHELTNWRESCRIESWME